MATYRVWAIVESPTGGLANPVHPSRSWMIAASLSASPDESGWLFLGGSVATGARFRFTSKEIVRGRS
jgi:hypothetical protein